MDTEGLSESEQLKKALCNSLVAMYLEEPFKTTLKTQEKFTKVGLKETY